MDYGYECFVLSPRPLEVEALSIEIIPPVPDSFTRRILLGRTRLYQRLMIRTPVVPLDALLHIFTVC